MHRGKRVVRQESKAQYKVKSISTLEFWFTRLKRSLLKRSDDSIKAWMRMRGRGDEGTFVQNVRKRTWDTALTLYSRLIYSSTLGFFTDDTLRVTHEFVTPRYRARSAPEYPNSLTPIQDIIPLASTISRLQKKGKKLGRTYTFDKTNLPISAQSYFG